MKMSVVRFPRRRWRFCSAVASSVMLLLVSQLATRIALAEDALNKSIILDIKENTELEDALIEWGTKAGMTVMINTPTVSHQVSHGIHGTLSARKALLAILRDSGLSYTQDGERIRIVPAATLVHSALTERQQDSFSAAAHLDSDSNGSGVSGVTDDRSENEDSGYRKALDTVVVTAQKREELAQDVPVAVTALSAQDLVDSGKLRLEDYYDSVPGLTLQPAGQGGYIVNIRGLSQLSGPSTVSILIDGVPFGGGPAGGSVVNPDLDPSTLQRVEVLRGPQGTLWGASAMGGIINFVTATPSTSALTARVQADVSGVANGDGPNYSSRGTINIPLTDSVAILASGFGRRDTGYIDNVEPQPAQRGVNWGNAAGGRLAAMWRPNEDVSLLLSAMIQHTTQHGVSAVLMGAGLGDLKQEVLIGTGGTDAKTEAYSAVLNVKLTSNLDLTSRTGYGSYRQTNLTDETPTLQAAFSGLFGPTAAYTEYVPYTSYNFTQELQLTAHLGNAVDWLVGGYYADYSTPFSAQYNQNDPTIGEPVQALINQYVHSIYRESAAFTNLTFHLTSRFDLQLGGRESFIHQDTQQIYSGYLAQLNFGTSPYLNPPFTSHQDVFTYLVTPSFKISQDSMVYARFASGYRPGGSNGTILPGVPPEYGADTTHDYELGFKSDMMNHKLTLDTALYYIPWKNIQIPAQTPDGIGYQGNGGGAKSEGVEASLQAHPFRGTTIGGWMEWNEAILTEPVLTLNIPLPSGQLPAIPRWSGNISVEQEFPLGPKATGFVGGVFTYVGTRQAYMGGFYSPAYPRTLPSYTKTDLNAGARYGGWTVNLYANNVMDRRGELNIFSNSFLPGTVAIIPPRTIGLSVSRSF